MVLVDIGYGTWLILEYFRVDFILALQGVSDAGAFTGSVDQVYAEARMFEPLTWLEAAVFFVLVLTTQEKSAKETARNYELGKQRWQRYLQTKSMVAEYQDRARIL